MARAISLIQEDPFEVPVSLLLLQGDEQGCDMLSEPTKRLVNRLDIFELL